MEPAGFSRRVDTDKEGGRFSALKVVDSPEQHGVWIRGDRVHGSGSVGWRVSCDVAIIEHRTRVGERERKKKTKVQQASVRAASLWRRRSTAVEELKKKKSRSTVNNTEV